ncbi:hypothetical protein D3C87_1605420 [compost metagenome]
MQVTHGDARSHELMGGAQRRWQCRRIELREALLCVIQLADQQKTADVQISRMGRVDAIAVGVQRDPRRIQGIHRPAEVP